MKSIHRVRRWIVLWAVVARSAAAPVITSLAMVDGTPRLTIQSNVGFTNQIEYIAGLDQTNWLPLTNLVVTESPYVLDDPEVGSAPWRFYRVAVLTPPDMVVIPGGSFLMGDTFAEGDSDEEPTHTVSVSVFYMDQYEVTKGLWDKVYLWATNHGYSFVNPGLGKAANHPVHSINWYDMAKWCNARSEMEDRTPAYYTDAEQTGVYRTGQIDVQNDWVSWNAGYRLPTEAEWEKAARGGGSGHRFPWREVDTISHTRANYNAATNLYPYDVSVTQSYNPAYANGETPYTSPVGSFAPNAYGLFDMAGNVWEWCWDWYDPGWYTNAAAIQTDTPGPVYGVVRVVRGASWNWNAIHCRVAYRQYGFTGFNGIYVGFRTVLPVGQP